MIWGFIYDQLQFSNLFYTDMVITMFQSDYEIAYLQTFSNAEITFV